MSVPSCSSLLSVFRRIRAAPVLTVLALALVTTGMMTGAASARDTLRRGEALYRGGQLTSGSGEYLLEFLETGGNVVLYRKVSPGLEILWETGTYKVDAERFIFQMDGNVVVYDSNDKALWSPNVNGRGGFRLVLQDDGDMVIYTRSGERIWASNTKQPIRAFPVPPIANTPQGGIKPPLPAPQPDPGVSDEQCDLYANEAVKLAVQAETLGVSPGGPRWSQSYKAHYRFCKSGVPPEILFAEHDARVDYLKGHAPKGNSAFEDLLAASLAAILAEIANGNTSSR